MLRNKLEMWVWLWNYAIKFKKDSKSLRCLLKHLIEFVQSLLSLGEKTYVEVGKMLLKVREGVYYSIVAESLATIL